MSTQILLADDHTVLCDGLRSRFEKERDMEVIGEARDGRETLEVVRKLVPDVVIMDIGMPNLNGIDATRQIVRQFPEVRVIALTMYSNKRFVIRMLKAGALGYILKESPFEELIKGVRTVLAGETFLSPKKVTNIVAEWVRDPHSPESLIDTLTHREREVFQLLCEGRNRKQIALELHVTRKAIDKNINKIKKELKADSIVDLIIIALQEGFISLDR